jgi:hypothetical protein
MDTNEITDTTTKTFTKEGGFSCWDVIKCIMKFEKLDRPKTRWFGAIDWASTSTRTKRRLAFLGALEWRKVGVE